MLAAAVTFFLAMVTTVYVLITGRLAKTAAQQLSASVQPVLELAFDGKRRLSGTGNDCLCTTAVITNRGPTPVKLVAITAALRQGSSPSAYRYRDGIPITSQDNEILLPNKATKLLLILDTGMQSINIEQWAVAILVECTDLAGVSRHSFYLDHDNRLRHLFGKEESSRWAVLFARMKRLKAYLDRYVEWENVPS